MWPNGRNAGYKEACNDLYMIFINLEKAYKEVINKEIMTRQKAWSDLGKRQTEIQWLITPRNYRLM